MGTPALIALAGEYDIARQGELRALLQAVEHEGEVIVDLTRVTYIDSSALRALSEFAHARGFDNVGFVVPENSPISRLWDVSGLRKLCATVERRP